MFTICAPLATPQLFAVAEKGSVDGNPLDFRKFTVMIH
jgi:hypothetical protein